MALYKSIRPKTILISDCGTEFCNKVIKSLADVTGTEESEEDRRITSAYNPRTDGLVERANQTIINVLRKCAEADHQNWMSWIPFVEYSYNTRKHSVTKYSPFELQYGVKPNNFIDYNLEENKMEDEILFNRSLQLKNLIENTRKQALDNIEEGQERQKNIQNKRTNPTNTELKEGDLVMVKCEGLLGKLESRYHGRFFIKNRTDDGNYRLLNSLGKELEKSYPVTKLKPILEDEELSEKLSVEIHSILDKRKNEQTNKIEYLVRWKELDESENEWVPEDHFDEFKLINEFNAKIHRDLTIEHNSPIEKTKRGRGRPKRVLPMLTIIINFIFLFSPCFCHTPGERFVTLKDSSILRCDTSRNKIVQLQNNCLLNTQFNLTGKEFIDLDTLVSKPTYDSQFNGTLKAEHPLSPIIKTINYLQMIKNPISSDSYDFVNHTDYLVYTRMYVLAKQQDEISGDGYECSLKKSKKILTTTFYNTKLPPVVTSEYIKLTKQHCLLILKEKMCANQPLICVGDTCKTKTVPNSELNEHYGWWKSNIVIEDICTLRKVKIIGENTKSDIFAKGCTATKEFCELENSVVIWNKTDVIHDCPYEIVREDLMIRKHNNIMQTLDDQIAFEVLNEMTVCKPRMPIKIYKTSEGLFLSKVEDFKENRYQLSFNRTQISTNNFLTLALIDNNALKLVEVYRELNTRNCYSLLNMLQLLKQTVVNNFYRLKDFQGEDLILYIRDNQIYIPNCEKITEITVHVGVQQCYEHIPITYLDSDGTSKDGYLIARSETRPCLHLDIIILHENKEVKSETLDIIRTNGIINVEKWIYGNRVPTHLTLINTEQKNLNFQHDSIINNVLDTTRETLAKTIGNTTLYYTESLTVKGEGIENTIGKYVEAFEENFQLIKIITLTIIITTIITILLIIIGCFMRCCNKIKGKIVRTNYIQGFLPTHTTRINNLRRKSDSSIELDAVTQSMLRRLNNMKT